MCREVVARGFKEGIAVNVSKVCQGDKLSKGDGKRLLTWSSPGNIQFWPTVTYTTPILFKGVKLQVLACITSDPVKKDEYNFVFPAAKWE